MIRIPAPQFVTRHWPWTRLLLRAWLYLFGLVLLLRLPLAVGMRWKRQGLEARAQELRILPSEWTGELSNEVRGDQVLGNIAYDRTRRDERLLFVLYRVHTLKNPWTLRRFAHFAEGAPDPYPRTRRLIWEQTFVTPPPEGIEEASEDEYRSQVLAALQTWKDSMPYPGLLGDLLTWRVEAMRDRKRGFRRQLYGSKDGLEWPWQRLMTYLEVRSLLSPEDPKPILQTILFLTELLEWVDGYEWGEVARQLQAQLRFLKKVPPEAWSESQLQGWRDFRESFDFEAVSRRALSLGYLELLFRLDWRPDRPELGTHALWIIPLKETWHWFVSPYFEWERVAYLETLIEYTERSFEKAVGEVGPHDSWGDWPSTPLARRVFSQPASIYSDFVQANIQELMQVP